MTLPKLPLPDCRKLNSAEGTYTAEQMLTFQRETVEACAKVADKADEYNRHISREIADAIRSMK